MGLKKLFKKTRKALGLPALTLGTAAKLGAAVASGGLGAGALALGSAAVKSKLKSAAVGGAKQVLRSKAAKALAKKIPGMAPAGLANGSTPAATTMPGGAPLKKLRAAVVRRAKKPKKEKVAKGTPGTKATGGKRKAPKGGLDLKGLSASWKKAGKPGTWAQWVGKKKG